MRVTAGSTARVCLLPIAKQLSDEMNRSCCNGGKTGERRASPLLGQTFFPELQLAKPTLPQFTSRPFSTYTVQAFGLRRCSKRSEHRQLTNAFHRRLYNLSNL